MKRTFFSVILGLGVLFLGTGLAQDRIERAKIFQENYPLITESDLYCTIFVLDGGLPGIRTIGADRQGETRGIVRIDKTCGEVSLGGYLVPFEEREGLLGMDQGYPTEMDEN